jgi:hypothetical protein
MNPLIILGAVAVGGYFLLKGSGSSSTASAQQAAAAAPNPAAYPSAAVTAFDSQAQALGMTQDQAQSAYDQGVTAEQLSGWLAGQQTPSVTASGSFYDPMSGAIY